MSQSSDSPIPFALPSLDSEEESAVIRVLRSKWLTTGGETKAFEAEFASFMARGGRQCSALAVNSATSGLHLALEACGIGSGDVVILPSYTFTATAEVARYLGADVAFVDVAPGSYLIDLGKAELTIERLSRGLPAYPPRSGSGEGFGPRGTPRAIMPVHFAGLCCDMRALNALAKRHSLRVIEDAAHSFPSLIKGEGYAGTLSDIGVFSFYVTKPLACGEGGMIVSSDEKMLERMSVMRLHGIDRDIWKRYTDKKASWRYDVVEPGYKYNMTDIAAAIGRVQLSKADRLLGRRVSIAKAYDAAFSGDDRFLLPPTGEGDSRYLYPLRVNRIAGMDRDRCVEQLQARGIGISVHFIPLHTMSYYSKRYSLEDEDFPEAFARFSDTISLPIWPDMSNAQVERVIRAVKELA